MNAPEKIFRILVVEVRTEQDVVIARQRARELAGALGFDTPTQTQVATGVSEIARNAFQYAGGGRAEFAFATEPHPAAGRKPRQMYIVTVSDTGPGFAHLDEILAGTYRSKTGLGIGVAGTHRLMDRVEIKSDPGATSVRMTKFLPPNAPIKSAADIQRLADEFAMRPVTDPLQEIRVQGRELIAALEAAQTREEELARVNNELAETNTGVLALYDELETLHRISMMLASKLELKPLIQSIIDVTTSLTNAEIGIFFFREEDGSCSRYATAGPKAGALDDVADASTPVSFETDFPPTEMIHFPDIGSETTACERSRFVRKLIGGFPVRSCLTVPVQDAAEKAIGAFLFASGQPHTFTERSERILTSIATQAAVGIEKAQLFQTVTAASDAKDQFFATLSHELRTPLNPALAIVSSLQRNPRIPADLREDITVVARNIRLEAHLIDDLLDFNRLIKGKLELKLDVTDVHALIQSVLEICRDDILSKNHELTVELDAERCAVMGDAPRIQQVLWNILKNAIKFTPAGGHITVRTVSFGSTIRVTVTDTGIGIDRGFLDRLFSAFSQGEKGISAQFGGLGLGLSIARMFVELHHGTIAAASPGPGLGSTITVEIPLTDTSAQPRTKTPQLRASAVANHGRILLVDDHADTLHSLARMLERRGFEITQAGTAAEAISAARLGTFDLLVSDLGLPDSSGFELVASVQALQLIPALALSGYGMEADVERSRRAGFDIHITKPIDFEQLIAAVNGLLAPGQK